MPTKQKPPMECNKRQLYARDDMGDFMTPNSILVSISDKTVVFMGSAGYRYGLPRTDFDALVSWYTGTEKKARAKP